MKYNKKAGIFAAGMFLGTIIFIGLAWWAFATTNQNIHASFTDISSDYQKNLMDRYYLYINESKKLAASQAFYELAKEATIDRTNAACRLFGDYIIWSTNCKPEISFIKQKFIYDYNNTFYTLSKKYPQKIMTDIEYFSSFEESTTSIIKSTADIKKIFLVEKTPFAVYNISYDFDPSTSINLSEQEIHLDDFELIYNEVTESLVSCKEDTDKIKCISDKISLERWDLDVKKEGPYLLFDFNTKKFFFFEKDGLETFAPINLKFAVAI